MCLSVCASLCVFVCESLASLSPVSLLLCISVVVENDKSVWFSSDETDCVHDTLKCVCESFSRTSPPFVRFAEGGYLTVVMT